MALLVTIILVGCSSTWLRVRGPVQTPSCSIQMPEGWVRLNTEAYEMVSKDGPYLEYILLREQPLIQGFQHTRRKLNSRMLPNEAAQVIVDNLKADPVIKQFRLIANEPADVGGQEGFHLIFTYRDQQDVDMRTYYYGTVIGSSFVSLRYNAAQRHYFDAELPSFQDALQSLRCSSNPPDKNMESMAFSMQNPE
jgi:hypothetical protein